MVMRPKFPRNVGIALVVVLLVAVGAVAWALWGASGSGSAYSEASSAQSLTTLDVSASTTGTLYPGGTGDATIKISNPNPYAVRITGVAGAGSATVDAGHSACTTAGITFTDQTGLSIDVPAGTATQVSLSGTVGMSTAATDACQGAAFAIPVTLTGTQM